MSVANHYCVSAHHFPSLFCFQGDQPSGAAETAPSGAVSRERCPGRLQPSPGVVPPTATGPAATGAGPPSAEHPPAPAPAEGRTLGSLAATGAVADQRGHMRGQAGPAHGRHLHRKRGSTVRVVAVWPNKSRK